jgi:StAR-related lipid transfer protein 3
VSTSGGGGIVKSRDFVNLRCWKLIHDSKVVEDFDINLSLSKILEESTSRDGDNEISSDDAEKNVKIVNEKLLKKSASDAEIKDATNDCGDLKQLSKSLGAAEINCTSDDEEPFLDAQAEIQPDKSVFVSAAISVDYSQCPQTTKYIRGDNIVSCWAMRPDVDDKESCVFEWVLCIDLKGSLPKYVLNTVSTLITAFSLQLIDYPIINRLSFL